MVSFLQVFVAGLLLGCLYAGMALGFSLMFGVLRIFNLIYGEQIVLGAYVAFSLTHYLGVPYTVSVLVAALASIVAGALIYYLLIERMLKAPIFNQIVITFGGLVLVENLYALIWGVNEHTLMTGISLQSLNLGLFSLSLSRSVVAVVSVLFIAALYLFLTSTRYGRSIYATSLNERASRVCGIDTEEVKRNTFLLASALAGVGGALMALVQPFGPFSGLSLLITIVVAVVLGGMGSIFGTLFGGLVLGLVVSVGGLYVPGAFTSILQFLVLILVLVFRPEGLMGMRSMGEV